MAYLSTTTIDPYTRTVTIRDHGLTITATPHALVAATLQFGDQVTPFDTTVDTIRDPGRRATQEAIHAAWMTKAADLLDAFSADAALAAVP